MTTQKPDAETEWVREQVKDSPTRKAVEAGIIIPQATAKLMPLTRARIAKAKTRAELELLAQLYNKSPAWVGYVIKAREVKQQKKRVTI